MIVQGKLFVEGEVRNILSFDLLFEQGTDWSGKPCRRPQLEGVFIQLESTKNDELFHHWITSNHAMKQGKIIFYGPDGMKEWRKYEFWDCECVSWEEKFRHNTTDPMGMKLKLIPAIFKTPGGTIAEKNWKVSDPFIAVKPYEPEEIEPTVIDTRWMDKDGENEVDQAVYGDEARLWVQTEDANPGEELTLTIIDADDKYIEAGTRELTYSGIVEDDGAALLKLIEINPQWKKTEKDVQNLSHPKN